MFNWVSAGATYPAFGGICAYVRFRKRAGDFEEIEYPEGNLFKLFDREVFFVSPGIREYNHPNFPRDFDIAVNADYLGINSACVNSGLMFIYESKSSQCRHRFDKSAFTHGKLFVDSGGFKLASGSEEFIDPKDLARYLNTYATFGMTLDLPVIYTTSEEVILRHAEVQKLNTEIILENLQDDVVLYNVSHGFKESLRRRYIDHVYRDDLDHWAVGASYYGNVFDFLGRVFTNIEHVGKNGKSFHVFGVANTLVIPILAWLGRYHDITSDASTPIQCARNMICMELHGLQLKKLRSGVTDSAKLTISDNPTPLSCSCNVCRIIGTNELFFRSSKASGYHLLGIHNTYTMATYARLWSSLALTSDLTTFKSFYKKILPKAEEKTWLLSLDYIEEFENSNLATANKKFMVYKTSSFGLDLAKGCPSNFSLFTDIESDDGTPMTYADEDHMLEVLTRYEDYHNGLKLALKKKKLTKEQLRTRKDSMKMGLTGSGKPKTNIKKKKPSYAKGSKNK